MYQQKDFKNWSISGRKFEAYFFHPSLWLAIYNCHFWLRVIHCYVYTENLRWFRYQQIQTSTQVLNTRYWSKWELRSRSLDNESDVNVVPYLHATKSTIVAKTTIRDVRAHQQQIKFHATDKTKLETWHTSTECFILALVLYLSLPLWNTNRHTTLNY